MAGYFYVRNTLSTDSVAILDKKEPDEENFEEKPVRILLNVKPGIYGTATEYTVRLNNTSTVLDMLENLRAEQGFTFERVAYTYGTELDFINGVEAPEGYAWKMFFSLSEEDLVATANDLDYSQEEVDVLNQAVINRVDITYTVGENNVVNNAIYELELTPDQ